MTRTIPLLILVIVTLITRTSVVHARDVHHTLFTEDWRRTPQIFKSELLMCLHGPKKECRASKYIAEDPAERVARYAREGFGMEVDELLSALDTATTKDCTGIIETMFVDEEGNFNFRTRKCKKRLNGRVVEQLFVIKNGPDIAGPCANPNKRKEITEISSPPAEEVPAMRMVCGGEQVDMPSGYLLPDNTQGIIGFTRNFGATVGSMPRWYGLSGRSCHAVLQ